MLRYFKGLEVGYDFKINSSEGSEGLGALSNSVLAVNLALRILGVFMVWRRAYF